VKSLKVHVLSKLLNRDMLVKVLHRRVLMICVMMMMMTIMVMIGDFDDAKVDTTELYLADNSMMITL